jgi:ABC-type transporter Mla subunit MlaD
MDLEARVATVEEDLTVVREVEIPALRAETERKLMNLRTETRGWAEIAVRTAGKVDQASEIVNLIYRDLREVREVQDQHTKTLDRHTKTLDRHTKTLDRHTKTLDRHTETLDRHTKTLDRHTETLDQHTKTLDQHTETLEGIATQVVQQGVTLQRILAKLS